MTHLRHGIAVGLLLAAVGLVATSGDANAISPVATSPHASAVCSHVFVGPSYELASAHLADGVTLVEYGATANSSEIHVLAVGPGCTIDTQFGTDGTATISLPHALGTWGRLQLAPVGSDRVAVFGSTTRDWFGTELSSNGAVDTHFGSHGWVTIRPRAEGDLVGIAQVSAIAVEPNGTLLVGGDAGEPLCCTYPVVYALHPDGAIDRAFGSSGFDHVLGQGSPLAQLVPTKDGSVFAIGVYLNMGYGSLSFTALNAHGVVESSVTANLRHDLATLPKNGLNGGVAFPGPNNGLVVIGSASTQGNPSLTKSSKGFAYSELLTAQGRVAQRHFFSQPLPGVEWWAGAQLSNGFTIASTLNYKTDQLMIRRFSAAGTPEGSFGSHGIEAVAIGTDFLIPLITEGPPGDFVVVVNVTHGARLIELAG